LRLALRSTTRPLLKGFCPRSYRARPDRELGPAQGIMSGLCVHKSAPILEGYVASDRGYADL
jgi:hypothetical protein